MSDIESAIHAGDTHVAIAKRFGIDRRSVKHHVVSCLSLTAPRTKGFTGPPVPVAAPAGAVPKANGLLLPGAADRVTIDAVAELERIFQDFRALHDAALARHNHKGAAAALTGAAKVAEKLGLVTGHMLPAMVEGTQDSARTPMSVTINLPSPLPPGVRAVSAPGIRLRLAESLDDDAEDATTLLAAPPESE